MNKHTFRFSNFRIFCDFSTLFYKQLTRSKAPPFGPYDPAVRFFFRFIDIIRKLRAENISACVFFSPGKP